MTTRSGMVDVAQSLRFMNRRVESFGRYEEEKEYVVGSHPLEMRAKARRTYIFSRF